MRIIAYTANAELVCPDCLHDMLATGCGVSRSFPLSPATDMHGIPFDAVDNEDNDVHPVFSTDELEPGACCGECRAELHDRPAHRFVAGWNNQRIDTV